VVIHTSIHLLMDSVDTDLCILWRTNLNPLKRFKEFNNEVENQLGKSIRALRLDRGGEYLSQGFDDHLRECGSESQLTPLGTPLWNGVSERRNWTLWDMVRSMISQTDLPILFWGYALLTAVFTLNPVPSKINHEDTIWDMEWEASQPVVHEDLRLQSLCKAVTIRETRTQFG
jgi:hypothetical protein